MSSIPTLGGRRFITPAPQISITQPAQTSSSPPQILAPARHASNDEDETSGVLSRRPSSEDYEHENDVPNMRIGDGTYGVPQNKLSSDGYKTMVENLSVLVDLLEMSVRLPPSILDRREFPKIHDDIQNRPLNPKGTRDTDHAIVLEFQLQKGGIAGLTHELQRLATRYGKDPDVAPQKNYRVVSDANNRLDVMNMASTQHFQFISHMIRGDIAYQFVNNPDFKKIVDTDPHKMIKTPGCYIQTLVQREVQIIAPSTGATQVSQAAYRIPNPHKGCGLTGRQMHQLYLAALRYFHGPNKSAADIDFAIKIDKVFTPYVMLTRTQYINGARKYIKQNQGTKANTGNQHKFDKWLSMLKVELIDRIEKLMQDEVTTGKTNSVLDEPFHYTMSEVGYGVDVLARATAHNAHQSSNALFTFYLAMVHGLFDEEQQKFEVLRFQTNRLSHYGVDAHHHALISDVGQTILAGSEWHQGGLNPQPGGGAGVHKDNLAKNEKLLQENFVSTYQRQKLLRSNLVKTRHLQANRAAGLTRYKNRAQIMSEIQEKNQDLLIEISEMQDQIESYREDQKLMRVNEVADEYVRRLNAIRGTPQRGVLNEDKGDEMDDSEVMESVEMYD